MFEDTFNVPSLSEIEELRKELGHCDDLEDRKEIITKMEMLPDFNEVIDLTQHNKEMDELSDKLMSDYKEVFESGLTSDPRNAAELFKAAATMADISLKAKLSKIDARMKAIQLTINKNKLMPHKPPDDIPTEGIVMDRNELLKQLASEFKN